MLPAIADLSISEVMEVVRRDKKVVNGKLHFVIAIQIGAMLMALARQNRATPGEQRRLSLLFALSAGIWVAMHDDITT